MFIENDRFIIRKIIKDDTIFLHNVLSNPNVMRYIEEPYTLKQTTEFVTQFGLTENPRVFSIQLKDGDVIGYCIFGSYGDDFSIAEIGWVLSEAEWGKGLSTDITKELLFEAKKRGYSKAVIEFHKNQIASEKIAKKFHFQYITSENSIEVYELVL